MVVVLCKAERGRPKAARSKRLYLLIFFFKLANLLNFGPIITVVPLVLAHHQHCKN